MAYTLPQDVLQDLLQWCSRYGLLGSLLLRCGVVLAPRWSAGGSLSGQMHGSRQASAEFSVVPVLPAATPV